MLALSTLAGCSRAAAPPPTSPTSASPPVAAEGGNPIAVEGSRSRYEPADVKPSGVWIGASAEGEMLPTATRDTFLGVWVDVPEARPESRPPMEVVLVVDTSGSMAGEKIQNARNAASTLVRNLRDGDIVGLDAFSDHARTIVSPTRLDAVTRAEILRQIANLRESGSTNMFEGLTLAEGQIGATPASHPLRRVVLISDGIANVGPSSPEVLGAVAERGLRFRAQVTSLGVGNDYDERTLNALALKSSGRLYHLSEPREMANILKGELDMLDATLASEAFVEIVPAPGVQVLGADGVRSEWHDNALRIALGSLHAGQHREALVRVRIVDPAAFEGHTRSMASVRLRFRDAQENDLERIQEVVAKTQLTGDSDAIARTASSRANAIAAIMGASKQQLEAAQRVNDGNFVDADKELAKAQATLQAQARVVTAPAEKKRLEEAERRVAQARVQNKATAAAPKPAQRARSLEMNADAMHQQGF